MFTMARKMRESQKARLNGERGATPIEILAGLVLLGIIFSFIIVKFFSWRETTQDKGAQAKLRDATLAAESIYTTQQNYVGNVIAPAAAPTAADCQGLNGAKLLGCIEPALSWTSAAMTATLPAAGGKEVHVNVTSAAGAAPAPAGTLAAPSPDAQAITLTTRSESGRLWCMKTISDDAGGTVVVGTTFGGGSQAVADCAPAAVTRAKF